MSVSVRSGAEHVHVLIHERLSYTLWGSIFEAILDAEAGDKTMSIDVAACAGGDCGGVAAVLAAQRRAREVALCGCHGDFVTCFKAFGVCRGCAQNVDFPPGCPKRDADDAIAATLRNDSVRRPDRAETRPSLRSPAAGGAAASSWSASRAA